MKTFGDNMKRIRESKGASQADIAEAVGVSQSNIAKLEKEGGSPRVGTAMAIADHLGVKLSDLAESKQEEAK